MPFPKTRLDAALAFADAHMDQSLDRLRTLVSIKSVSTDPAYKAECQRAADWLVSELKAEGFDASARPTPGHPVVVVHSPARRRPSQGPCFMRITTSSRSIRSISGTPIHSP